MIFHIYIRAGRVQNKDFKMVRFSSGSEMKEILTNVHKRKQSIWRNNMPVLISTHITYIFTLSH